MVSLSEMVVPKLQESFLRREKFERHTHKDKVIIKII